MSTMLVWVHCNKCFARFSAQFKFYITNCYHVYCANCLEKLKQRDVCLLCNANKPAFLQLNNEMPESVKVLFGSFEEQVEKTHNLVKFQMKNCLSLLQQSTNKYNRLKSEYLKLNNMLNAARNEIRRLNKELMVRQTVNRNSYESSTPAIEDINMSASSPYFNNITVSSIQNPTFNHKSHSEHATKIPQPNYRYGPNPVQRTYPGKANMLLRPSPVQMGSAHTLSSRSSGLSSLRNISLLGSAQRQPHNYRTGYPKF